LKFSIPHYVLPDAQNPNSKEIDQLKTSPLEYNSDNCMLEKKISNIGKKKPQIKANKFNLECLSVSTKTCKTTCRQTGKKHILSLSQMSRFLSFTFRISCCSFLFIKRVNHDYLGCSDTIYLHLILRIVV
jgi:hypothetical protein